MKLDYCFHSHTSRCGHAIGKDEDFVIHAIEAGVKYLGCSDHVFLPGKTQPGIRGEYSLMDEYKSSVLSLKEKYKDKVNIYLGFECEYYDEYIDYYKHLLDGDFDYLILGQHCYLNEDGTFKWLYLDEANKYVVEVEKAMKSGLFLYFAHPDLIFIVYKEFCKKAEILARKICELSKKYNVPLEINLNGMTIENRYPFEWFWKIVGEEGCDVVIGYDAHQPELYQRQDLVEKAFDWVNKYNLKLLTTDELVNRIKR